MHHCSTYLWSASNNESKLAYALRKFASKKGDLDISFDGEAQFYTVTQILSECLVERGSSGAIDPLEVWDWSLKKRLQALLALSIFTRGPNISLQTPCPSCRQSTELPVDLNMFYQDVDKEVFDMNISSKQITLRLPNGSDQREIYEKKIHEIEKVVARNLIKYVDGGEPDSQWEVPSSWITEIEKKLVDSDGLMDLRLHTSCPACEHEFSVEVDLEQQLLTALKYFQKNFMKDIHQLALVYHWNEDEICSLSPQRRQFYIKQIREMTGELQ